MGDRSSSKAAFGLVLIAVLAVVAIAFVLAGPRLIQGIAAYGSGTAAPLDNSGAAPAAGPAGPMLIEAQAQTAGPKQPGMGPKSGAKSPGPMKAGAAGKGAPGKGVAGKGVMANASKGGGPALGNAARNAARNAAIAGKPGSKQPVASATSAAPPNARPDPFVIPGINQVKAPPPSITTIIPPQIVTNWQPPIPVAPTMPSQTGPQVASLPNDRVAGIMLDNGVYAIVESGGESQVVQPGDTLPGGETVVSIQNDSVTFRTAENQTVNLPISAGNAGATMGGNPGGAGGPFGGGYPGGPFGGGYPGPGGGMGREH